MDKHSREERERALMRKLDLGKGVSVTMGIGDEVNYFFTNKVEGIKKASRTALGELEVEFSSTRADDERLLQNLHTAVIEGR